MALQRAAAVSGQRLVAMATREISNTTSAATARRLLGSASQSLTTFWTNELHVAIDVVRRRHTHAHILPFYLFSLFWPRRLPSPTPASLCLHKFRLLIVLASWRLAGNWNGVTTKIEANFLQFFYTFQPRAQALMKKLKSQLTHTYTFVYIHKKKVVCTRKVFFLSRAQVKS